MCEPPFTREEEQRMHTLQRKADAGEALTAEESHERQVIEERYQLFIEEGQRRLRDGATRSPVAQQPTPSTADGVFSASTVAVTVSDSLSKAGKAAYFWGSLLATAVPGYLVRKADPESDFLHWNCIVPHLILGALPVVTQVGSSGNHLEVLRGQLAERNETLGMVVACPEEDEMTGFGIGVLQFAQEADWRGTVNTDVRYARLPFEDTTAKVSFDALARVVNEMHQCIDQHKRTAYVFCKAGKGRSWMVVMCYLVSYGGMTYDEAAGLVVSKRKQVNPSIAQQCFVREFPIRFAKWHSLQDVKPNSTASSSSPPQ